MITALLSVTGVLLAAAFVFVIAAAQGRVALWVSVLLLVLANLVSLLFGVAR